MKKVLIELVVFLGSMVVSLYCTRPGLEWMMERPLTAKASEVVGYVVVITSEGISIRTWPSGIEELKKSNIAYRYLLSKNEISEISQLNDNPNSETYIKVDMEEEGKQKIKIISESALAIDTFIYEASNDWIKPLSAKRFSIIEGALYLGFSCLVAIIITMIYKKRTKIS